MKRLLAVLAASLALALLPFSPAAAVVKAGGTCTKINSTRIVTGYSFTCVKSGKKLAWSKGVKVVTPTPTPTPTATATPTPTPTPTPSMNKTSDLLSAQCVASIIKISSQDMSAGMPSGMDELNACLKDTGVMEIITSSPFNPADIGSITKFRSCTGHDYAEGSNGGKSVSNDPQYEKFSSMKHYLTPLKQNANNRIDVFAPFNGIVSKVTDSSAGLTSQQSYANAGSQVDFIPYANPSLTFTYFHIYGLSAKAGDAVSSGEKIAYNEVQSVNVGHSSFDIAMSKADIVAMFAKASRKLSMMNYLSPKVASFFAQAGLTPQNSIWSAAYRIANPCTFTGNLGFFQGPENPADRVTLKS